MAREEFVMNFQKTGNLDFHMLINDSYVGKHRADNAKKYFSLSHNRFDIAMMIIDSTIGIENIDTTKNHGYFIVKNKVTNQEVEDYNWNIAATKLAIVSFFTQFKDKFFDFEEEQKTDWVVLEEERKIFKKSMDDVFEEIDFDDESHVLNKNSDFIALSSEQGTYLADLMVKNGDDVKMSDLYKQLRFH